MPNPRLLMSDAYVRNLARDRDRVAAYYRKSVETKTEQQKRVEALLEAKAFVPEKVADIACGGGGASYHLSRRYPEAAFTLVDANEDAVAMAAENLREARADCRKGDVYQLCLPDDAYDLTVFFHTLMMLDDPDRILAELVRITRPGGLVIVTSLFNFDHDVDLRTEIKDRTRDSYTPEAPNYIYRTYCVETIREILDGHVSSFLIHPMAIGIDLPKRSRGLDTYTVDAADGHKFEISGGMLMNWGLLEITV